MALPGSWDAIDEAKFADERDVVARLLSTAPLNAGDAETVASDAAEIVRDARKSTKRKGLVEDFLQEFSLGTQEGVALMCLAEALLRIPDDETRDQLIAEKIASADWTGHLGHSDSLFVNASTWGLMLTGKLVSPHEEARQDLAGFLRRLAGRIGEPLIRRAVATAVGIMSEQFVLGRTIRDALTRARREELICSFDMLGEGARTEADASKYAQAYAEAIDAVGKAAVGAGPETGHGISVKLSALSPRYEAAQEERVWDELYPRLHRLAEQAAAYDLNLTIDAEEADRLVLSLKLLDRLAREDTLGDWSGLGLAVQAYQKRALEVIGRLYRLAEESHRRLMVRLVKGAYWDSEIKAAQVAGMADFPVFTTKAATDMSYLACADALLAASPRLYPQFATHNAHTFAAIRHLAARHGATCEFQRLHGMGEAIYNAAQERYGNLRLRTYAPVGDHEALLPYLVRRLLENGANSSFVHLLLDEDVPVGEVVADPMASLAAHPDRNPRILVPPNLYGKARRNSPGRDWSQVRVRTAAAEAVAMIRTAQHQAGPIIAGKPREDSGEAVACPGDPSCILGRASPSRPEDVDDAVASARKAQSHWDRLGGTARARVLRAMADGLEREFEPLAALVSLEGGKTGLDAIAELREAIDFCNYYAVQAERLFEGAVPLPGPAGERNQFRLGGRGVFACISPWNFPLAIFTGQIAAALAAGNAVIAKSAEQTPLIAAAAVRIWHKAGLDPDILHLLPGPGPDIGAALVSHPGIDGIAFTGGTDTAWAINRQLALRDGPIVPLIAETGGINAMFVDTSALREQVIDDVVLSAFGSAGQRCSALRVLFLPDEIADDLMEDLKGALFARKLGDPARSDTDIGPVIDAEAISALEAHLERLKREARVVARHPCANLGGNFFAPVIAEIPEPDFLEREVFGPILHVCRYRPDQLEDYARRFAARGFGLTLGIHSRIEAFARKIQDLVPAGNVYVNRSIIGAVVGVQPFGGRGLSGTGPKAGGPHSLLRFANEQAISRNIMAEGGDPDLLGL